MTFLCIVTWLLGFVAFIAREPPIRIKLRTPVAASAWRIAMRWASVRRIARQLLGATLMAASMFVAAMNARTP